MYNYGQSLVVQVVHLTKLNNSVSMNKTNERDYTMFTSAYELKRARKSMRRAYGFALLCSFSV